MSHLKRLNRSACATLLLAATAFAQDAGRSGLGSRDREEGALNARTYRVAGDPAPDAGAEKDAGAKKAAVKEAARERKLLEGLEKPEDPEILRRFDANADGLLDDAERLKMFDELGDAPYAGPGPSKQDFMKKHDKDGDGTLDKAERGEIRKKAEAEHAAWRSLVAKYDRDGDKKLSAEERAQARESLDKEFPAEGKEEGAEARFFKNPREFREEIARNKVIDYVYVGAELDSEFGHEGGGEGLFWDSALSGGGEFNYKNLLIARLVGAFNGHDVDFVLDEALVRIGGSKKIPVFAEGGHSSVPFGEYNSHFRTDPFTQVLGEVEGWYATAGYDTDQLAAVASIFRGKDGAGDYDVVAAGSIQIVKDMDIGASWTSDISESLELRKIKRGLEFDDPADERDFPGSSSVMGGSVFFTLEKDMFDLDVEFVTALGYFRKGVLAEHSVRPWALNVEAAVRPIQAWEIAARFEMSYGIPDTPHYRVGLGTSFGFCKYATASVEFLYGISGGGETDKPIIVVGLTLRF